jgi:hypothetical protein
MELFPKTLGGCRKIETFDIPKFWMFISFSNQALLENTREISYSLQKDLSNGIFHASIKDHLIPPLRGFLVGNQIPNLIPNVRFF